MSLVGKANDYHTKKNEHEKQQWTLWRYPFETKPYRDLKGDNSGLTQALYIVRGLATYLSTEKNIYKDGGCLTGDSEMYQNTSKKKFKITLKALEKCFRKFILRDL